MSLKKRRELLSLLTDLSNRECPEGKFMSAVFYLRLNALAVLSFKSPPLKPSVIANLTIISHLSPTFYECIQPFSIA